MKLLWVKTDFLHPATRGGQIRTLEMLRRLHARHTVHYVAFEDPAHPEGPARAPEYCSFAYPIRYRVAAKNSWAFGAQLLRGLFDPVPVAVSRYRCGAMRRKIAELTAREYFDSIVCDFLFPTPNMPDLDSCVLFQHNVEWTIWQRHTENASDPWRRWYFSMQARRMFAYEGAVCRKVKKLIAVSENDAAIFRKQYGAAAVAPVPTGVDLDYFAPPASPAPTADLVFLGSMDWMANEDAMLWFAAEVLPLIRRARPDCRLAIVGRRPTARIRDLVRDPLIEVTGTVVDVRPWLWGAAVSIVPLRVGGGTRLKIYEAMAARVPVVSTSVGAEGLDVSPGENIAIGDTAADLADRCLALLDSPARRAQISDAAHRLVATRYSWDAAVRVFEDLLQA